MVKKIEIKNVNIEKMNIGSMILHNINIESISMSNPYKERSTTQMSIDDFISTQKEYTPRNIQKDDINIKNISYKKDNEYIHENDPEYVYIDTYEENDENIQKDDEYIHENNSEYVYIDTYEENDENIHNDNNPTNRLGIIVNNKFIPTYYDTKRGFNTIYDEEINNIIKISSPIIQQKCIEGVISKLKVYNDKESHHYMISSLLKRIKKQMIHKYYNDDELIDIIILIHNLYKKAFPEITTRLQDIKYNKNNHLIITMYTDGKDGQEKNKLEEYEYNEIGFTNFIKSVQDHYMEKTINGIWLKISGRKYSENGYYPMAEHVIKHRIIKE